MYHGIVFFDLDGTLLNQDSVLTKENQKALADLEKNNYLPVIVSGRAPWEIETLLGASNQGNFVSLNGQIVKVANELIYEAIIPTETVKEVVAFSGDLQHSLAFYGKADFKLTFVDQAAERLFALDNVEILQVQPNFYQEQAIHMLYLFSEEKSKDFDYQQQFQHMLTMVRDSPYSMAMTAQGNSKKTGIQHLLKAIAGDSKLTTYAFGDGNNDLPMFEIADYSIAMANGTEEIKAAADFITKANVDGGIVAGLKHYGLI
ncbi:Cof subfamily protein (haloacid dehalogenase superfamily) [Enterococcus sp. PF1-24]|uniref:Cof-type HAD-IIB family hydrolase n=1 Tax=unclassified Enterococcus TaxID=2608891 RepID=UPI002474C084|nr:MULTISPECIES: Cof-type HAD-IIB family hydrolase [unclassified Enterococcus]MDH6364044.1 Cof subfamily protein (haloacid dehalogenase superfamily) [Enterococcus sp. PFB1-1]MDH6401145.1 Cof subfamily protein (haloacid dehalogenase superfamily) [Enterococcus sp. PF1-24]